MKMSKGKTHIGVKGTGGSPPQNTKAGSSARPGKGKFPIPSSAPMDMHTLGRTK